MLAPNCYCQIRHPQFALKTLMMLSQTRLHFSFQHITRAQWTFQQFEKRDVHDPKAYDGLSLSTVIEQEATTAAV